MSPELIGIFAVGAALAGLNWQMVRSLNVNVRLSSKMDALARDQRDLRERVARIEIWLQVLLGGHRSIPLPLDQGREAMATVSPTSPPQGQG